MFERSATAAEKRRLVLIFTGALAVAVVIALVAVREMGRTMRTSRQITSEHAASVMAVERLSRLSDKMGRAYHNYTLTGDARVLAELDGARRSFAGTAALLRELMAREEAQARSQGNLQLLLVVAAVSVVLAAGLAWLLSRTLAGLARSRAALDASLVKLERANRDLDSFAGRVAHDLRNILAPLPLNADRLRRAGESRENVEAVAGKIERIAHRADGLMEALLAFARAGQPSDLSATASVRRVVAEATEDVAAQCAQVDAQVKVELEDLQLACAHSLLYTVVANLLTNALKFVDGRLERRVTITARQSGLLCTLTVEDTGPGIPPAARPHIFQPFFRAPDAKGRGTGIGLATVQRIVDAHGGCVSVESTLDLGTTFTVRLPLARPSRRSDEVAIPIAASPVAH